MRRFLVACFVLTVCVLSFFSPCQAAEKSILIGNISDFTGTYSAMAKMQKDAVEMAVAELNAGGGLLGRQIATVTEDSETSPSAATRKFERLVLENNVDYLIGTVSSAATLAMMEIAKKYNKILMVPISQSVDITGDKKNKQTFRTCANPGITSGGLAKYMVNKLGKKVYMLTADYAWGKSTSEQYHTRLKELKADIVGETFFPLGNKDFAPYFGKIKAARPDILFITAAGNDAIAVVSQLDQYGLKKEMKICGDGSLIADDVLPTMGKTADGIITADYYAPSLNTKENKAFVAEYEKLYKARPSKFSVSSYEAIMWLAQAVKKAGSTDVDKVVAALEGSMYVGPQGVKKMDPSSHQTSLQIYMIEAENGALKIFANVE